RQEGLKVLAHRPETRLAGGLLVLVLVLWAIAELAERVVGRPPGEFDESIMFALRRGADHAQLAGPTWIEKLALDLTVLGGVSFATLLVLVVVGFLLVARHPMRALEVVLSTAGGGAAALLMKEIFERPRPDVVPALYEVTNPSFPSGHATVAAVVYLTLAILIARFVKSRRQRLYVMLIAFLLVVIVGWTRVALGVHYPTDVLAGWALGLVWSLFSWLLVDYWETAREKPPPALED
ncbi:MAG: phosphatase PAP2 family protein, partial [Persicimonas sp.]